MYSAFDDAFYPGGIFFNDERTLCSINTEVSVVCQSRSWLPAEIGAVCWRAMATPCTSVFTPWYFGSQEVPRAYQTGTNQHTGKSAYWTFRDLSRFADVRYETVTGMTTKEIQAFENKEFEAQAGMEKEALALNNRNKKSARRFLSRYSNSRALESMGVGKALSR